METFCKNNNEIKKFKRLLKELGIYSVWLKEIKSHLKRNNRKIPIKIKFNHIGEYACNVGEVINLSFCWAETNNETMWRMLSNKTYCLSIEECLSDEHIGNLKKIVKRYG